LFSPWSCSDLYDRDAYVLGAVDVGNPSFVRGSDEGMSWRDSVEAFDALDGNFSKRSSGIFALMVESCDKVWGSSPVKDDVYLANSESTEHSPNPRFWKGQLIDDCRRL